MHCMDKGSDVRLVIGFRHVRPNKPHKRAVPQAGECQTAAHFLACGTSMVLQHLKLKLDTKLYKASGFRIPYLKSGNSKNNAEFMVSFCTLMSETYVRAVA